MCHHDIFANQTVFIKYFALLSVKICSFCCTPDMFPSIQVSYTLSLEYLDSNLDYFLLQGTIVAAELKGCRHFYYFDPDQLAKPVV
jgi:hypothetical protein